MKLTSENIEDIKRAMINEVKDTEYGDRKAGIYMTLDNVVDLDLGYNLSVAPIVESGLTLIAEIDYFEAFDFNGDSVEVENKELIKTITVKLW